MSVKDELIDFHQKTRKRTNQLIKIIPTDKLDWTYLPGKFTIGDLVRHIAVVERYMYMETLCNRPSLYTSQHKSLASDLQSLLSYSERLHSETRQILEMFSEADYFEKCTTPTNFKIARWKWIRAMFEHEIHHRGQLYIYLNLLGLSTPPMFGLTSEELITFGQKPKGKSS